MTQKVSSSIDNYQINSLARERIDAASDILQSHLIYLRFIQNKLTIRNFFWRSVFSHSDQY